MIISAIDDITTKIELTINAPLAKVNEVLPLLAGAMIDSGESDMLVIKRNLTRRLQYIYRKYLEEQRLIAIENGTASISAEFTNLIQNDVLLSETL